MESNDSRNRQSQPHQQPPQQQARQPYQQAQQSSAYRQPPQQQSQRTQQSPHPQYTAMQPSVSTGIPRRFATRTITVGHTTYDSSILVTIIGALLVVVGVFAPFVQASMTYRSSQLGGLGLGGFNATQTISRTANLMNVFYGLGWVVLVGAAIVVILAVVRQNLAALVVTVLDDLVMVYAVARAGSEVADAGGTTNMYSVSYGFGTGAWLLVIGAIIMLIGTILAFYNEVNIKKNVGQAQVNSQQNVQSTPTSAHGQEQEHDFSQRRSAEPLHGMTPDQANQVNGYYNPPQAQNTRKSPMGTVQQGDASTDATFAPQQGTVSFDATQTPHQGDADAADTYHNRQVDRSATDTADGSRQEVTPQHGKDADSPSHKQ